MCFFITRTIRKFSTDFPQNSTLFPANVLPDANEYFFVSFTTTTTLTTPSTPLFYSIRELKVFSLLFLNKNWKCFSYRDFLGFSSCFIIWDWSWSNAGAYGAHKNWILMQLDLLMQFWSDLQCEVIQHWVGPVAFLYGKLSQNRKSFVRL